MQAYFKLLARLIPSALTFLAGAGALFLADIIISRSDNLEVVAQWATLRSFMVVGGICALFGLEQIVVREPMATKKVLRFLIPQILIVGIMAGIIGKYFGFVPSIFHATIIVIGFAFANLSFQWLRSNLLLTRAYIANGSWRVLFLVGLCIFFFQGVTNIGLLLSACFLIALAFIAALIGTAKPKGELISIHDDIKSVKDIYGIGITYFMAALSLAIASYGENLVVHQLGTSNDVAIYFRSLVTFLFPAIVLNQYFAAIAGPKIRQNEKDVLAILRRYWVVLGGGVLIFVPLLYVFGRQLEIILYGERATPALLAVLLVITCGVRFIYILPSSFVGVTANRTELKWTTLAYLGCALLLPLLSFGFVKSGGVVIISVAVANLINWTLRCLVGTRLIFKRYNLHFGKPS